MSCIVDIVHLQVVVPVVVVLHVVKRETEMKL